MTPIVRSVPLGGGSLARAVSAGTAPPAWYERAPTSAAVGRARAERVRATTGAWLDAFAPAIVASGAAATRLARAASHGVLVTSGQQPGLFGGPMYTWSKALAALALADALEDATGIPTAPLFWAATDDADFAEAAVTHLAIAGGVETLRLAPPPAALAGFPMSELPLGEIAAQLAALERASGSVAFPGALLAARAAYATDATVGGAYVRLLREVLGPLGVSVLDSSHESVREAAFPTLRAALARAAEIEAAGARRAAELREAGHAPQVEQVAGLSLVFRLGGAKERIRIADASRELAADPAAGFSPNVLLRPVVERAILPTVAYVAGPGELAYFAQVSAVADELGASRPLAVPRWSGMVVEPHIQRLLDRHGLTVDDLADESRPEREIAMRAMPEGARRALEELRGAIEHAAASLSRASAPSGVGAPPAAVAEGARRSLLDRVDRLERRYLAAAKRGQTTAMRDVATLRAALRPLGRPQERTLNLLPILSRHGPALLERMLAEARRHAAALVTNEAVPAHDRTGTAERSASR